jgi:hypothetical protein
MRTQSQSDAPTTDVPAAGRAACHRYRRHARPGPPTRAVRGAGAAPVGLGWDRRSPVGKQLHICRRHSSCQKRSYILTKGSPRQCQAVRFIQAECKICRDEDVKMSDHTGDNFERDSYTAAYLSPWHAPPILSRVRTVPGMRGREHCLWET